MPVDPRFVINLKGKQFVMLGGLLDLAHNGGLIGIETLLDKELSDPKEQSYVFQAIGRFRTDAGEAVWSAYGDASPSNSQMRGATLRHAETRAIARMLRMATNVAMCSVEELGPDGTSEDDLGPQRARPAVDGPTQSRNVARHPARPQHDRNAGAEPVVGHSPEDPQFCHWPDCGLELTADEVRGCRLPKYQDFFKGGLYCKDHRQALKDQQPA
jgi:hypothetical protein